MAFSKWIDLENKGNDYVSIGICRMHMGDFEFHMYSETDGTEMVMTAIVDAEELKNTIRLLEEDNDHD